MTTPRPFGLPPTISGFAFSSGFSSSSTAAKNASRSRCATITLLRLLRRSGEKRLHAGGFLLHLPPRPQGKRRERIEADATSLGMPHAGDAPVDEDRLRDVPPLVDHNLPVFIREDAGPLLVREQRAVPHAEQECGCRRVGWGDGRPSQVEELATALVA